MKATINGVTYEGTVDEIRDIVENPPCGWDASRVWPVLRPYGLWPDLDWSQRNWDGSPRVTC